MDWITILLPIINALGIPILAFGIVLLVRAYHNSTETYQQTSTHLREENERLRKRLSEADAFYFTELENMHKTVNVSIEAIKELEGRKIALLSKVRNLPDDEIRRDIVKINDAIAQLSKIMELAQHIELQVKEILSYMNRDRQAVYAEVGETAEQIADTASRLAVIRVITSEGTFNEIAAQLKTRPLGLVMPVRKKQTTLPSLTESDVEKQAQKGATALPASVTPDEDQQKSLTVNHSVRLSDSARIRYLNDLLEQYKETKESDESDESEENP